MSDERDECYEWHSINGHGYGQHQTRQPMRRTWEMHRLIYKMAHGEIPSSTVVRHLCGNKRCVRLTHLAAGTQKENMADAVSHGTIRRGESAPNVKLSEADVIEIRRRRRAGELLTSIAGDYGISFQTVHDIDRRRRWRHVA